MVHIPCCCKTEYPKMALRILKSFPCTADHTAVKETTIKQCTLNLHCEKVQLDMTNYGAHNKKQYFAPIYICNKHTHRYSGFNALCYSYYVTYQYEYSIPS